MHKCYHCGNEITSNTTATEHIIPNALGGRLKCPTLLCRECNSKLGQEVDGPFCHQMGFVVNRLGITREKGSPPAIKARLVNSGEPIHIESSGATFAPRTWITRTDEGYTVACDRQNIKQAAEALRRKAPNVRITRMEPTESDVAFQYEGDLGGMPTFRAVTKIALNYYLYRSGPIRSVHQAVSFVKNGGVNTFVIPYYCTRDVLPNRCAGHITHAIVLRGDPVQKLLYAYVELFTAFRFFVSLADPYDGDHMNDSYCFDLREGKTIETDTLFYESRTTIAARAAASTDVEAFQSHVRNLFAGDLQFSFA
jgi:hypothetical protein